MAPTRTQTRTVVGVIFLVVVFLVAVWTIWTQRGQLGESLVELGPWPIIMSCALATIGTAFTYLEWREVLRGLGVTLPLAQGARVFFLSQLGKYLPGSIWPVVMQMEAGRARGASRATMVAANLFTLVVGCTVGLIIACVTLPFAAPGAFTHYWWALLALPVLLAMLHPATMPRALNVLLRFLRRAPITSRLPVRYTVRSGAWASVSYLFLGSHIAVMVGALGGGRAVVLIMSVGAISLAVCVGVLALPVPAGLGVRDGVLVLTMAPTIGLAPALLVTVTARVLTSLSDLLLATMVIAIPAIRRDEYLTR
ncbi:lysylphosphatidylglycerol synthase domain-containing protein [Nocardioides sp. NPDC051685]|uniref:lysylphosphatidylglycerol synthase domain-containing protein n=1 Tax=Nocardioides sp. NPDC051685 TaxID=3364334 RepID=UPI00379419DC